MDDGLEADDGKQPAGEGHDTRQGQDDDSKQRLRACDDVHTTLLGLLQKLAVVFYRLGGLLRLL